MRALIEETYTVDIEVFEGPLDLLLYLLRREELDIYDIPIEHITRQYVKYIEMMRMLDLSVAGEFLVMASTLMVIKSRMLLPVEERAEEEESAGEETDPRWDLVRQLVEYKKYKDAAACLMRRERVNSEMFCLGTPSILPGQSVQGPEMVLGDIGLFDLLTAFQSVLERLPDDSFGHLEPMPWTVTDKMEEIISLSLRDKPLTFSGLFHQGSPRREVIVTFLALLELLRLRQVAARQSEVFGTITIEPLIPPAETGAVDIHDGHKEVAANV